MKDLYFNSYKVSTNLIFRENLVLLALLAVKEMKEIELLLLKIFKLHGGLLETLDLQVFLALMVTMAMMADQEGLVFPVIR